MTEDTPALRACTRCKTAKPHGEFNINRQHKTGRHPWCRACCRDTARQRYMRDRDRIREAQRWRNSRYRYGLTEADFRSLLTSQDDVCAACQRPQSDSRGARLCVDHDHQTGAVRGLLCTPCNLALGYLNDDPDLVAKLAAYLRRHVE